MSDLSLLTPRQAEVLNLMSEGLCNKEISKKLNISDSATDCHITNVLEKLKVNNRTKAAATYFKIQLTQDNNTITAMHTSLATAREELAQANTKIDRLCDALLEAANELDEFERIYVPHEHNDCIDKYRKIVKEIKDKWKVI